MMSKLIQAPVEWPTSLLQTLVDTHADPCLLVDTRSNLIRYCNKAVSDSFLYAPELLKSMPIETIVVSIHYQQQVLRWSEFCQHLTQAPSKDRAKVSFQKKDGDICQAEVMIFTADAEAPSPYVLLLVRMIQGDTKEQQLHTLLERAPISIVQIQPDGSISYANKAPKGYRVSDIIGTSCYDYIATKDIKKLQAVIHNAFMSGKQQEVELQLTHAPELYLTRVEPINKPKHKQEALLFSIDITTLKQHQETIDRLSKQIIKAHEDEKQHISRNIHDTIGQSLPLLKMKLQGIRDQLLQPKEKDVLDQCIQELHAIIDTVRYVADDLRPDILDFHGLRGALEHLCTKYQHFYGIPTSLHIEVDHFSDYIPQLQEIEVYRIIQEAIINAQKHSEATKIDIYIFVSQDKLRIEIKDVGTGFDTNEVILDPTSPHSGIRIMYQRAEILGAEIDILSKKGVGSSVLLSLPLQGGLHGISQHSLD